jgi:hypothetical protein
MILYILNKISVTSGEIKELIDVNLKRDYGRIKQLLSKAENLKDLEHIVEHTQIVSEVATEFSIDKLHAPKNFRSLLYYMGLVTIDKDERTGTPLLKIPNYSSKTMYWEYMENIILDRNPEMMFNQGAIYEGLVSMAFDGCYKPFFDSFQQNFVSQISNKDLVNFSEKNVKFLLLSILFQNNFYLPISELENSTGYSDIYLQRRNYLYPKIQIDWL